MKLLQYLLGLVLMCCNLLSCDHKELCFDHSHIASLKVAFDWVSAPEANPESMSLYLFSEDGTNPQRYELSGREGGTIRVSPGTPSPRRRVNPSLALPSMLQQPRPERERRAAPRQRGENMA